MRILHVTTFLQGGAGRIISALAIAQARSGHDVRLIVDAGGEPGYASYPEYLDALQQARVPILFVASTFKRAAALNELAAAQVKDLARVWPPDIVHVHAGTPSFVVRRAGAHRQGPGTRLVHTMHGWGISKTPQQAADDLDALERADVVTTPSRAAADGLHAAGLHRQDVRVIAYGLPESVGEAAPDPADAALIAARQTDGVALCIGTIGARKNQHLLLAALKRPEMASALAVFIGDGDSAALAAAAQEHGVAERTIVLGRRVQASRYLALADALVLPSRNEGLPIAVLEGLRAGIPIVAANIPEIAEAVGEEGRPWLFPSEDASGLARAWQAARQTSVGPRSAHLRKRFLRHYAEGPMLTSYDDVYADAGQRPPRELSARLSRQPQPSGN